MTDAKKEFTAREIRQAALNAYHNGQDLWGAMFDAFAIRLGEDEQRSKRTGALPLHIEMKRREAASSRIKNKMDQGRKSLAEDGKAPDLPAFLPKPDYDSRN